MAELFGFRFERMKEFSYINKAEADTINKVILPQILEAGIPPESIAIISPYKAQVDLIKREIQCSEKIKEGIKVESLDSCQGMEFDVITDFTS